MKGFSHPQYTPQGVPRQHAKKVEYLSVSGAATYLDMSPKTFRKYLPEIPGVVRVDSRLTRIPIAGLKAWLSQFTTTPTQQHN